MRPEPHPQEAARLAALRAYGALDTEREKDFDDLAALASRICATPIALVTLVDEDRQWFKAAVGTDLMETPRDVSLCAHAILAGDLVEVEDATLDPRFADNPLVTGEPSIRFYAGVALQAEDGLPLGTLCVLDTKPRRLDDLQRETLRVLARQVVAQLKLRRQLDEQDAKDEFLKVVTDRLPVRVGYLGADYRYRFMNGEYERRFGLAPGTGAGKSVAEVAGEGAFQVSKPFLDRAFAGDTHAQEFRVPYEGGERRVEVQYVADRDPTGAVRGVVIHVLDVTERFAETEAVREREARYRALFDGLEEGFCVIEMIFDASGRPVDYRFREINPTFSRFTDISAEDALAGRTAREIYPTLEDHWFETYGRVATTGESARLENRAEAMGKWFEVHAFRIGGEGSVEVGVLFKDVSERRRQETALAEERARQDRTLENAEVATFDWDVTNDRVFANPLLARFFGVSAADAAGGAIAGYFASVHPDDRERVQATIRETLAAGGRYETEYRVIGTEGRVRNVLARGDATLGLDGRARRLSGVVLDVTERVRAETAREESETRRRMALDAAGIGSWNIDIATLTLTGDARFYALFGGRDEPFDYEAAFAIVHPDDRETVRERVEAAFDPVDPVPYAAEYRVIHPDGSIHWLSAAGRANFRSVGPVAAPTSLDGTVLDITERRRTEAERERLIAELANERERLEALFQIAPSAIAVIRGPELRFEFANDAYRTLVGRDEVVGKTLLEALPDIAGQGFVELLQGVMATGEPFSAREVPAVLRPQAAQPARTISVDLLYQAIREADGTVSGVFVHAVDVTESVLARRRIEESEAKYRTLFTTMSEGYCVAEILLDDAGRPTDYRFVAVNDAFERLTGIPLEAARSGRTIRDLTPGAASGFIDLYGQVALAGRPEEYTQFDSALDRWFEGRIVPFGGEGSLQVAALFNEVTETKRAEIERERLLAELAAEREKLDTVLALSPSFITILRGEDLRFEYANPSYRQLLGNRPLIGRTLAESQPEVVTGGSGGQEYDRFLRDVMASGETLSFARQPVRFQAEPGAPFEERILDFVYQPLREGDGRVTGVLVQGIDVTERAHAEREIAEREELFRAIFQQAPDDAILVMDRDRTITAWNPAAERVTGWTAAEAMGRSADLLFTSEDRAKGVPEGETDVADRDGKAADERWHVRKDGSRFWGIGTMNALHDEGGGVRGYLKVFRDATDLYVETRTLAFLRLLTDTVIDLREPERIIETVERMLGEYLNVGRVAYAEASADGATLVVHQEWAPNLPPLVGTHRLSDFGPVVVEEFRAGRTHVSFDAVRESGDEAGLDPVLRYEIGSGISVPMMAGGRLASVVIVHDRGPRAWTDDEIGLVRQVADRMTSEIERARAEQALRTSEERFRQLVDLSPSTVWFGELDGGLSFISQDFYDATGLTPDQALPHGWTTTVHPLDLARVAAEWETARREESVYDTEFRIRYRSGEYRWLSVRALPVRDKADRVVGWLGSNTDIQEQKETEETLRTRVELRTEELQRAVKEAEGFNYSISHDLRSPLRAMVATASILLEEAGPGLGDEHREMLVRQAENAKRLGRLIDELLRLSRLARVAVNRERLDMSDKARQAFEDLHDETNGCRLEVQPGMVAEGDPGLVRTVLQNLIGNACKFSPNGGVVRVGQKDGVFSVADEGVGFDMRFASKIFLPFERLVSESEFPGTGIGLANVKRIVERHRGRAWVESEPGKGTTFFFTLGEREPLGPLDLPTVP